MTKTKKKALLEAINTILTGFGWVKDTYGNYKKDDIRIKMNKTSMRYEYKNGSRWVNIKSDYYKNVVITDHNNIVIKGLVIG